MVDYTRNWFELIDDSEWSKGMDTDRSGIPEMIWKKLSLKIKDKILDCPCGPGDIAIGLSRLGGDVTCVDRNRQFIQDIEKQCRDVTAICMDMRDLSFQNEFDLVINWWNSLGYFSDEENCNLLKTLCEAVRPGGRILIEGENIAITKCQYPKYSDGKDMFWDDSIERVGYRFFDNGKEFFGSAYFPSPEEYRSWLSELGMSETMVFGPDFNSFDENGSEGFIIVSTKPI